MCMKIWRNWRANKMIEALSDAQISDMRLKIRGYDIFFRKKADWGYDRVWVSTPQPPPPKRKIVLVVAGVALQNMWGSFLNHV